MKDDDRRTLAAKILTDVPESGREGFNVAIQVTMRSVDKTFPDSTPEVKGKICECVARIVSSLAMVPMSHAANTMESMFSAYIVSSAAFDGLIDLGDTSEHIQEIVDDAMKQMDEDHTHEDLPAEDEQPYAYTGQYL